MAIPPAPTKTTDEEKETASRQEEIEGLKIVFKTMPQDIEFLLEQEYQEHMQSELQKGKNFKIEPSPEPKPNQSFSWLPASLPKIRSTEMEEELEKIKVRQPEIEITASEIRPARGPLRQSYSEASEARPEGRQPTEEKNIPAAPLPKTEETEKPTLPLPAAPKNEIKNLYKEAKSLYKRKFYPEAQQKFKEILQIKPSHWRAKWHLNRIAKKIGLYQEGYQKAQQEA
jgi:TolA-binding protein